MTLASILSRPALRRLSLPVATLGLLGTVACGDGVGPGPGGAGDLPPLNAFFIPHPGDDGGSSTSQAACATGTAAYDEAVDIIDRENAALGDDRALIEALLASSPTSDGPIVTYEAEHDGRVLTVTVVDGGAGQLAFEGTLADEDGEHDYLSGAMANDRADGAINLAPPGGAELSVAWSTTGDTLRFARSLGDSDTAYDDSEDSVKVVAGEAVIFWNKGDHSGIVLGGESDMACFQGAEGSEDFCDTTCSPELLTEITDF